MKNCITLSFLIFIFSLNGQAASKNTLEAAKLGCAEFVGKLKKNSLFVYGVTSVPKNWAAPKAGTIPVFWWKRPGSDKSYPPLVFIHGGVAAQSWAVLDKWQEILKNYPGDFIAFDHRGEGCSKTISSNENPVVYKPYRIRNVVRDLEYFRKEIFKYSKWRLMGHSRGAAIIQYYLEMFPRSIESAHAMGFALMPASLQKQYTVLRAQGFYDTAQKYLQIFPEDALLVKNIKSLISPTTCWEGLDSRRLCGPDVMDILANTYLRNRDSWQALHELLPTMTDLKTTYEILDAQILKGIYGHFNYIAATNGQDFGNPDLISLTRLKNTKLYHPFLSEIKFVGNVMGPTVKFNWNGDIDPLDFAKVKKGLGENKIKYFLYGGELDPVAPPLMYLPQLNAFKPQVHFVRLRGVGHEGWYSSEVILNLMKKAYQ